MKRRPKDQSVAEWLADHDRALDPNRRRRGLRLPPLPERYRDPSPAERLVGEFRAELEASETLLDEFAEGYAELLSWSAGLVVRTLPDDEIERLLSDDPLGPTLPVAVVEDLRIVIAHARRLAKRAGLRPAARRDAA